MRVGAIKEGYSGLTGRPQRDAAPAPAENRAPGRALVALEAPAVHELPSVHRQAAFLAHLIATKAQHPQTRARRRAEPSEALTAYRAAAGLVK